MNLYQQIAGAVESFVKRELTELSADMEKGDVDAWERCRKWLHETVLHLAPLSEEHGGVGLGEQELCGVLLELGKASASFAVALLSHYAGIYVLQSLNVTVDRNMFYASAGLLSHHVIAAPFIHNAVVVEAGRVELVTGDQLRERSNQVALLGLQGCSVFVTTSDVHAKELGELNLHEQKHIYARVQNLLAAVAVGNAMDALRIAEGYANERYQGGDVIIRHGIVQEILGRMKAKVLLSEAGVLKAAAGGTEDKLMARALAAVLCEEVCVDAVQLLGGYGYMKDYVVERKLRDAKTIAALDRGSTALFKQVIEEKLL